MKAIDRINLLIASTPADQIDSMEFWQSQIRAHIETTDATDPENQRYLDCIMFMHHGAMLLDEANGIFNPDEVRVFFHEHALVWSGISGVRLRTVLKCYPDIPLEKT
jgi:hypothetical protein